MTFHACTVTIDARGSAPPLKRAAGATLAAACMATGAIAMTITSSSVVLASVQADLHLGITQLQWVLNSFIVSFALLLLPFGALSDRVGQRPLFLWGALVFIAGTVAAVLAQDFAGLVASRSFQGAGAALLTATGPAALTKAFSEETARKRAFGYLGASGGIGLALGALLAGEASHWGGWRAALALPVPAVAIALLVVLFIRDALARRPASPVRSNVSMLSLLRNRQFVFSCFICLLFTIVWVALFIYAPLHMQVVDRMSPTAVGRAMLALLVPALVMPVIASRLVLVLPVRAILVAGFVGLAVGLAVMHLAWRGGTLGELEVAALVICGIGAGTLYGLVDYFALTAVPSEQAGLASGLFNVVRLLGDIFAAVIPGAVVLHVVATIFAPYSGLDITPGMLEQISAGDPQVVRHLGLEVPAKAAFATGLHWAIGMLLGLTMAGLLIVSCARSATQRSDVPIAS
jgi:MFS family permease